MTTLLNDSITLLESSQAFKEQLINENVRILTIFTKGVLDKDLTAPPSTPNPDDFYIVAATATAEWGGQETKIAYPTLSSDNSVVTNSWEFFTPYNGLALRVLDESLEYSFNGSSWVAQTVGSVPNGGADEDVLTKNSGADQDYSWSPLPPLKEQWKTLYAYA